MSDFQFDNKDISATVRFLQYFSPTDATEENAIAFLEYMKFKIHEVSKSDLTNSKVEELYEAFLKSKSQEG